MTQASFSGLFKSELSVDQLSKGRRADYVLLGVPHDAGSTFRPGSQLGPKAIRDMAVSLSASTERGEDLSHLAALDAGDLVLPGLAPLANERIEEAVGKIVDDGAMPIVLGGDHAITVPVFTAVQKRHRNLSLLYLDAHPDLYPEYDGDPHAHSCVVHRILELPGMAGERITQVGIRATNPMQVEAARSAGIRTVPPWELQDFVYKATGPVYLSIDIDVLDPAHAPGCGNPVPGGLSTRELLGLLQGLGTSGVEIVGFDVVEVNPLLDPSGITALTAGRLVTELLGVM